MPLAGVTDGQASRNGRDVSGRAHHGTANGSPLYQTSAINGQPAVQFVEADGQDSFAFGNLSSEFPVAATLFMVARLDDDTDFNLFVTKEQRYVVAVERRSPRLFWRLPQHPAGELLRRHTHLGCLRVRDSEFVEPVGDVY